MKFLSLSFLLLVFTACFDDDDGELLPANPDCGPAITIRDATDVPPSDAYGIIAAKVDGLCLSVTLGATGCGTDGWKAELITDGNVAESLPTQSTARIILDDGVPDGSFVCQAEVSREFSFDLTPYLGNSGSRPSKLRLLGTDVVVDVE